MMSTIDKNKLLSDLGIDSGRALLISPSILSHLANDYLYDELSKDDRYDIDCRGSILKEYGIVSISIRDLARLLLDNY